MMVMFKIINRYSQILSLIELNENINENKNKISQKYRKILELLTYDGYNKTL